MYRNTKNVPAYVFGKDSIAQIGDLLAPRRALKTGPVVFFVDHFFAGKDLLERLSLKTADNDQLHMVDTTDEPSVESVDAFADAIRAQDSRIPVAIVAIGGGAVMDTAKAVANMLTNPGKAEDYQGWELVKNPAPWKLAVPTLSGTGSECSRTCVLLNERRKLKLGMNSDYTMFDQLLLDPVLTRTVPRDQYFYTGIDTYMHCFEALHGSFRDPIVDALSVRAVDMCKEIFLSDDMMSAENLEKNMIASYIGGMAAGNVGVVHPVSAGLSVTLHTPHGLANCLALSVLEDIYPQQYKEFMEMLDRQGVKMPSGICANLDEAKYDSLFMGSIVHEKPLINALGPGFKDILTRDNLIGRFKKL